MASSSKLSPEEAALVKKMMAAGIDFSQFSLKRKGRSDTIEIEESQETPVAEEHIQGEGKPTAARSAKRKKAKTASVSASRKSARVRRNIIQKSDSSEDEEVRSVVPDLVLEKSFLMENKLDGVVSLLDTQEWMSLLEELPAIDEGLIKEFYEFFQLDEKPGMLIASFKIKDIEYSFTSRELGTIIGAKHQGYNEYSKGQWPSSINPEEVTQFVGKDVKVMSLETRLIHRVVCQKVTPRLQKHGTVHIQDYLLMERILKGDRVNLPCQVMHHMLHTSSSPKLKHGYPYPAFVKKILQYFDTYSPSREVPAFMRFDAENCVRLGFKFDEALGWTMKEESVLTAPAPSAVSPPIIPLSANPQTDHAPVMTMLVAISATLNQAVADLGSLSERVVTIEESVKRMEITVEKLEESLGKVGVTLGKVEGTVGQVDESLAKVGVSLGKVEDSVDIGLVHHTKNQEELQELQRQLRYVGTTLLDDLKPLLTRKR